MFHLLYKEYLNRRSNSRHIFIVSVIVFIILNIVENVIHYNIGLTPERLSLSFTAPSYVDWVRIICVMIVFAILQGVLTMALIHI